MIEWYDNFSVMRISGIIWISVMSNESILEIHYVVITESLGSEMSNVSSQSHKWLFELFFPRNSFWLKINFFSAKTREWASINFNTLGLFCSQALVEIVLWRIYQLSQNIWTPFAPLDLWHWKPELGSRINSPINRAVNVQHRFELCGQSLSEVPSSLAVIFLPFSWGSPIRFPYRASRSPIPRFAKFFFQRAFLGNRSYVRATDLRWP